MLKIGDALALRATVAERVHLGGDYNLRLESNGRSFWLTESSLAAFVVDAHPARLRVGQEASAGAPQFLGHLGVQRKTAAQ